MQVRRPGQNSSCPMSEVCYAVHKAPACPGKVTLRSNLSMCKHCNAAEFLHMRQSEDHKIGEQAGNCCAHVRLNGLACDHTGATDHSPRLEWTLDSASAQ